MASEKTNENKTAHIVYWLLGTIALVGIIFTYWPQEDTRTKLRGNLKLSDGAMDVVNNYLRWTDEASGSNMDISHDFTADGLMKMADALSVLSKSVSNKIAKDAEPGIDTIKEVANLIVENPQSSGHADMLKKAFKASEEVLTLVQNYSFPKLKEEIKILNQKISAVKENELMLEQKKEVIDTHLQIAVVLNRMTNEENKLKNK